MAIPPREVRRPGSVTRAETLHIADVGEGPKDALFTCQISRRSHFGTPLSSLASAGIAHGKVHAEVHVRTLRVFDSESGDEVRPDLDGKDRQNC
jgi:hypothetical protein